MRCFPAVCGIPHCANVGSPAVGTLGDHALALSLAALLFAVCDLTALTLGGRGHRLERARPLACLQSARLARLQHGAPLLCGDVEGWSPGQHDWLGPGLVLVSPAYQTRPHFGQSGLPNQPRALFLNASVMDGHVSLCMSCLKMNIFVVRISTALR